MQIQLNTSNGIENKESLDRWADTELRQMLARFADDVTRGFFDITHNSLALLGMVLAQVANSTNFE